MARLNVEDIWWMDPRRDILRTRIGFAADAVALQMWRLAQDFHKSKRLVPKELYLAVPYAEDFLDAGLAEDRGEEVYIKGSNSHFEWLHLRRKAASQGGKTSAQRPRNTNGQLKPKQTQANTKQTPSKSKQTQVSSSSSFSNTKNSMQKAEISPPTAGTLVWEKYKTSWQGRYQVEPPRSAKSATLCKKLVDQLGADLAAQLAEWYPTFENQFHKSAHHPLSLLVTQAQTLLVDFKNNSPPVGLPAKRPIEEILAEIDERRARECGPFS